MTVGVLVGIAVLASVVMLVVLFFRRGRDELDLSPRSLVRVYLHLASLAGLVLVAIGSASLLTAGFAFAFGSEFAYGAPPRAIAALELRCPPGQQCPPQEERERAIATQRERERQQQERRRQEDLVRGLTFAAFGLVFWGGHRAGRRTLGDGAASGLRRAYLLFAAVAFGVATVVLLPTGLYQALSFWLIPRGDFDFRPGVADALAGGIVTLPFWLYFLRTLTGEVATAPTPAATAADVP